MRSVILGISSHVVRYLALGFTKVLIGYQMYLLRGEESKTDGLANRENSVSTFDSYATTLCLVFSQLFFEMLPIAPIKVALT